jgi:hypothetical protein
MDKKEALEILMKITDALVVKLVDTKELKYFFRKS